MNLSELRSIIEGQFQAAVLSEDPNTSPPTLELLPESILQVCAFLHEDDRTYFDTLSCLTGIDNGPEKDTMEVLYHLYSIPFDHHLTLKVTLPRKNPQIATVTPVWKAADWHEREAYDLVGIHFTNHPDLRRILLPADWEGHPLQKDYQVPEFYQDIKVKY